MKHLFRFFVIVMLCGSWSTHSAWAQLENAVRIELLKDSKNDEEYEVTSLGKAGVLLTVKNDNAFNNRSPVWKFIQYDTQLREQWKTELHVKDGIYPLMAFHNDRYLYWLFGEPDDSPVIMIYKVDLQTGEMDEIDGKVLGITEVTHFAVLGNTAFLGGQFRDKPVVAMFRFFDRSTQMLPGLFINNFSLLDLEVDEQRSQVQVVAHTTTPKSGCKLVVKTYTYEGKLLNNHEFATQDDKSLITGHLLKLNETESLLVGNYSLGCTLYSVGLYVTKISGQEAFPIKYIEFAAMENFFNYLKPNRLQKVKEKIARKQEDGKEVVFRYMLNVHDLLQTSDGPVMIAEAFYPQYHSNTTAYTPARLGIERSYEGYRYTHAIICGFDTDGNLRWDNNFILNDLDSDRLSPQVQTNVLPDGLLLAYQKEGKINLQVIRGKEIIKEKEDFELKTNSEEDKILNADNASLSAWYEQYFLAWGVQKIENPKHPAAKTNGEREVFYLSKFSYKLSK